MVSTERRSNAEEQAQSARTLIELHQREGYCRKIAEHEP